MYFKGVKLPSFSKPIITFPWDKKWSVNWHHPTSHPTSLIYPSLLIFSKEKPTIQQVHKNIGFYKKNPIQCFSLQYWFHKSIIFTMDYAFSAFLAHIAFLYLPFILGQLMLSFSHFPTHSYCDPCEDWLAGW